ncbi:hypothetical protein AB0J71_36830 [Nonomuraea sp. NPDC049637]|uniref:hypothetical protein n=1 Tax=Nonomuraea sp. NPDC049637 TaxID=3154356 RepID=UPI00341C59EA
MEYGELVARASAAAIEGWDFTALRGRVVEEPLPWSYERLLRDRLNGAASLLDLGTGGREFLAGLTPLPPRTAATEGHPPNLPIARRRLESLGVEVAATSKRSTGPWARRRPPTAAGTSPVPPPGWPRPGSP